MTDRSPDATPPGRPERRGSIGRFLDKFKSKRRSSSQQATTSAPTASATKQGNQKPEASPTNKGEASAPSAPTEQLQQASQPQDISTTPRAPSVDFDADDNAEDLVPSRFDRFGHSSERTRALFEKYGMTYTPSGTLAAQSEDDRKRIEKPVRVRIHWTCHECQRMFSVEKVCNRCGHRRCRDCVRSPPKKTKDAVAAISKVETGQPGRVADDTVGTITPPVPVDPAAGNAMASSEKEKDVAAEKPGDKLETDEDAPEMFALSKPRFTSMNARPRAAYGLMTPEAEAEWRANGKPSNVQMVATVQRVYKKPRQRIRYTCEHCQSIFVDRQRCRNCGHERCETCVRYPPRRVVAVPDPDLLKAVEDRLAAMSLPQVSVR